jgi:hypothetical protein
VGAAEDDCGSARSASLGTEVGTDDNEMPGTMEGGTVLRFVLCRGVTVLLDGRVSDTCGMDVEADGSGPRVARLASAIFVLVIFGVEICSVGCAGAGGWRMIAGMGLADGGIRVELRVL